MNVVEAYSLTKLYGIVIGVNDVDLEIPSGVHGLLGPNGAGKSTLLKLIMGQLRPSEGDLEVLGERPWNNSELFRRVGYSPEQDVFYTFLSGFEFVRSLALLSGLDSATARKRTGEALEIVGATDFMHRKIAGYSKGMRQRVKVAQALVHQPEFLVLDEPMTGTDPLGRRELMDVVIQLGKAGKSVLVSSHVLHEVQAMTDEFLLIYGGRVLASGNVHDIRSLMNEYPHRIQIHCDDTEGMRRLCGLLLRDLPISGLEIDDDRGEISVLTQQPQIFYEKLPDLVLESECVVREMTSEDDSLEAVFNYLVGAH